MTFWLLHDLLIKKYMLDNIITNLGLLKNMSKVWSSHTGSYLMELIVVKNICYKICKSKKKVVYIFCPPDKIKNHGYYVTFITFV